jgi:hypothetical protein
MRGLLAIPFLLAVHVARAEIAPRVAEARNLLLQSIEAQTYYVQSVMPPVAAAMRKCAPPGTSLTEAFQLQFVAYISGDGRLTNVEYSPSNSISTCLARELGDARFPSPPAGIRSEKGFPMQVEMTIKP